jgi:F-type H+-transporting ATPase subunit alpha
VSTIQDLITKTKEYGITQAIEYPIVKVNGLPGINIAEQVKFETGEVGYVSSIDEDHVTVVILSHSSVKVGTKVARTKTSISFPVGKELLGNTLDPLGNLIFENPDFKKPAEERYVDTKPKGIQKRARIDKQLLTGLTLLDILMPIGMGQRELVLGDRRTGKTTAIVPIIENTVKEGGVVIYATIGKRSVEIKRIQNLLSKTKSLESSVIIATPSNAPTSLIDLTPYSAMTAAEYFCEQGKNVLVVFDDLTTHAAIYREMALISRKFPGRESYPGDIFYKHARLLERAGNFTVGDKQAAITCLPIAETIDSDLSGYIISNLIGITDGHILFDKSLFNQGLRPSVDVFLSVTRVGKQTQTPLLRALNRQLTRYLKDYHKAKDVSHFGAEISGATLDTLESGEKLYNFISHSNEISLPLQTEVAYIIAIYKGYLKQVNIKNASDFKKELKDYVQKNIEVQDLTKKIYDSKNLTEAEKLIESNKDLMLKPWNNLNQSTEK